MALTGFTFYLQSLFSFSSHVFLVKMQVLISSFPQTTTRAIRTKPSFFPTSNLIGNSNYVYS